MLKFLQKRLLLVIPTLFGISLVNFAIIALAPGEAGAAAGTDATADGGLSEQSRKLLREQFHLDQPLAKRYLLWLGGVLRGDLGMSIQTREPVAQRLGPALATTVKLNLLAAVLTYALSVPLGVFSARRRGTRLDALASSLLFGLYSLPAFWVGTLLIIFLAGGRYLTLFPTHGLEPDDAAQLPLIEYLLQSAWHCVLPVFTLAYFQLAALSRYARVGFLDALGQDYVRTARAKGLPAGMVVWKHAARNAVMPLVTEAATLLPQLIGGSVVVEAIFGIHGMGRVALAAVGNRDFPMMMGINLLAAVLTLIGLIAADLVYAALDPRIELA